ncbi:MAG: fatty acid desaturase [Chitinophagales bacterium]
MLRYRSDWRTLINVMIYFVVAVMPWLLWPGLSKLQVFLWVVANCLMSFICATIVHNTIHVPIFTKRWMNRVFQVVLSFCYGHSTSAYVPGHNFSHHHYVQTPKDAIRTTKARFRFNLLNQLFFFYLMSGDILKGELRFAARMRQEKPHWFRQYLFEMILVNVVKIALLFYNWKCFVLFIFIPHQYAAWGIVGTNFFQHDGCDETHPYNHSRTFTGGFLNWLLFNNGYHGAHHMRPNLHWSRYPEFHEQEIAPHLHPSLNRRSLLAYLIEAHIYPGKRVDYLGRPLVLPPETADEDWVAPVRIDRHETDLGGVA